MSKVPDTKDPVGYEDFINDQGRKAEGQPFLTKDEKVSKAKRKADRANMNDIYQDITHKIMETVKPRTKQEQIDNLLCVDLLPLAKNKVNIISAGGGVGKSTVALRIMLNLSSKGIKSLGVFTEDTVEDVRDRLELLKDIEPDFQDDKMIWKTLGQAIPQSKEGLVGFIESAGKDDIELVVIDPLIQVFDGNENDNGDAKRFINGIAKAAHESQVAILFLHHSAKGDLNARGAGAITDACRVSYFLEPIEDNDRGVIATLHKDNRGIKYLTGKTDFTIDLRKNSMTNLSKNNKDTRW